MVSPLATALAVSGQERLDLVPSLVGHLSAPEHMLVCLLRSPAPYGRRMEEVLRKKLAVLLAAAMMLAVLGASPAFGDPDKNNPSPHSCGVEDSHRYVDEDTKPGASELSQEGFKPLDFGCAPGKEEDPRP
jgi:hypothetical protein